MQDPTKLLLTKFFSFAKDRLKFENPPRLFLRKDSNNAKSILGQTAHYDPQNSCITVFVSNRHPKDIIRSFAHELVHHCQNERGDLRPQFMKTMNKNYAQENEHMRKMEKEAYLEGNMCFRDWEDSLDNKLKYTMSIAENIYLKENKLMNKQTNKQKELKGLISEFLERKINIIMEEKAKSSPQAPKFNFSKAKRLQTIIASGRGRMKIPFNMAQINSIFGIEGDKYTRETYDKIITLQRGVNDALNKKVLDVDGVIGSNTHRRMMKAPEGIGGAYRDAMKLARTNAKADLFKSLSDLDIVQNIIKNTASSDSIDKIVASAPKDAGLQGGSTPSFKLRGMGKYDSSRLGAGDIDGGRMIRAMKDYAEYKRGAKTAGAKRYAAVLKRMMKDNPDFERIVKILNQKGEEGLSLSDKQSFEDAYGKYFTGTTPVKPTTADDLRSARISNTKGKFRPVTDDEDDTAVAPQGKSPQSQKEGKITKAHLKSMIQKILQEKLEDTEEIDEGSCAGTREDDKGKSKKKDCSKCPGCPECKPGLKKENEELEEGDGNAKTDKYDDNPKLKGGQKNLPDALQQGIIGASDSEEEEDKKEESKIQTPEQENALYESRFTQRNTRLFEKLLKEWTK